MPTVFSQANYIDILNNWLGSQPISHGIKSKMALFMGCQNSHLSRVLKDEINLTPDQAFLAGEFMKLNPRESDYFLTLVELARAGDPKYRQALEIKAAKLRVDSEDFGKRVQSKKLNNPINEMRYYSRWQYSALHVLTMKSGGVSMADCCHMINLTHEQAREDLDALVEMGLVVKSENTFTSTNKFIHLSKESPMNSIQHKNWRENASRSSQRQKSDGLHFTMVQTISEKDFLKIKELLFSTIDQYRKIADPSKEEKLICLCLDFFNVS